MKLIENLLLLLFTALLVLGVYNYIESQPKPEEDNPVVDVLPDDGEQEEPVETLQLTIYGDFDCTEEAFTIEFVEGMTWGEWVNSKYNTHGCTVDGSGRITYGSQTIENVANGCGDDLVIDATANYFVFATVNN